MGRTQYPWYKGLQQPPQDSQPLRPVPMQTTHYHTNRAWALSSRASSASAAIKNQTGLRLDRVHRGQIGLQPIRIRLLGHLKSQHADVPALRKVQDNFKKAEGMLTLNQAQTGCR